MTKITHAPERQFASGDWPRGLSNLPPALLVEHAIRAGNGLLSAQGALVADTAPRTGRSVKDKFIVRDRLTAERVAWGGFNTPIEPDVAGRLQQRIEDYLRDRQTFVVDAWAGANPAYRLGVRVVAEYAWHALFARQLFLRALPHDLARFTPGFTVLAAPDFRCDPERDGVRSDAAIILDFGRRVVTIAGTHYAGEIKKSVFSYLNYVFPEAGILPMHCSANVGVGGDVALFFGLSGTGKTTLSADPERRLIGDDEHGWGDDGVFNFEGGCYAKCVNLKRENEPQIYDAITFGSVLENVVLDPSTREPDYDDISVTENTRAAYPVEFIQGAIREGRAGHPRSIVFLTADAFGVLPPVARLDLNQALYYFLSGYTAKLAGTEAGLGSSPEATFSSCFAAPFLALPPSTFAAMLRDRIVEHGSRCYLVNTGWTAGGVGVGPRISLGHTRAIVHAILAGALDDVPVATDRFFGLHVPRAVPGLPHALLDPRAAWEDAGQYDRVAARLAADFRANFAAFPDVDDAVAAAGPPAPRA
jgi:phosphoenolpyruvate carboxykinase (ATP)